MKNIPRFSFIGVRAAFTLVELLAVIAIILLLMGLAVPALNSISKSNALATAGRLVGNTLTVARSEAINQGTLMQVRVVTNWKTGGSADTTYRKFSVWKYDRSLPTPDYVQISKWETLPEGIIFEIQTNPSGYALNRPGTYFLDDGTLSNKKTDGKSGSATFDYSYIQFVPTGAASFPATVQNVDLLLTEGFLASATGPVTYSRKDHPNWCQLQVTNLTGRIKTFRP